MDIQTIWLQGPILFVRKMKKQIEYFLFPLLVSSLLQKIWGMTFRSLSNLIAYFYSTHLPTRSSRPLPHSSLDHTRVKFFLKFPKALLITAYHMDHYHITYTIFASTEAHYFCKNKFWSVFKLKSTIWKQIIKITSKLTNTYFYINNGLFKRKDSLGYFKEIFSGLLYFFFLSCDISLRKETKIKLPTGGSPPCSLWPSSWTKVLSLRCSRTKHQAIRVEDRPVTWNSSGGEM